MRIIPDVVLVAVVTIATVGACSGVGASASNTPTLAARAAGGDPGGFGGYTLPGPLTEISAEWKVPTIAASSPAGGAATWIGAEDKNGAFIQLGTAENTSGLGGSSRYGVFWSDTSMGFRGHSLGEVVPGDQVSAQMVQAGNGWVLHFGDPARQLSLVVTSGYGGSAQFTRADWIQEDPTSDNSVPYLNVPYPSMSTVTFQDLTVNRRRPRFTYSDAQELATPDGVFLVPSRLDRDAFALQPADAVQAQYLAGVAPINAAGHNFYAAYQQNPTGATTLDEATVWMSAIAAAAAHFSSGKWPPRVRRALASFEAANTSVANDLSAWRSAGAASAAKLLPKIEGDEARASKLAQVVRADIGLPRPH